LLVGGSAATFMRLGNARYTLSFEAPGQDKPCEVFLTPAEVKYLRKHVSSRVE